MRVVAFPYHCAGVNAASCGGPWAEKRHGACRTAHRGAAPVDRARRGGQAAAGRFLGSSSLADFFGMIPKNSSASVWLFVSR